MARVAVRESAGSFALSAKMARLRGRPKKDLQPRPPIPQRQTLYGPYRRSHPFERRRVLSQQWAGCVAPLT